MERCEAQRIVALAQAKDKDSTRILFEHLRPRVQRFAYKKTRPDLNVTPDDLTQEGLIQAYRFLPKVKADIGNPIAYLYQVAEWRILDILGYMSTAPITTASIEECNIPRRPDDCEAECAANSLKQRIRELCKGSPRKLLVLELLLLEYSQVEIAEAIGCSDVTVNSYVKKIRSTARQVIDGC